MHFQGEGREALTLERGGARITIISVAVSIALLLTLYNQIDPRVVRDALISADVWWLVISIGATIPITLLLSLRFFLAAPSSCLDGYAEAVRLSLVATALNLFLPSKMGDFIKTYVVTKSGRCALGVGVSIVIYERLCDLLGVLTCCILGWAIVPSGLVSGSLWIFAVMMWILCLALISSELSASCLAWVVQSILPFHEFKRLRDIIGSWPSLHKELEGRRKWIVLLSMLLWGGQMLQMWSFTLAVSQFVPFAKGLGVFALATLAGQLPLTFGGLGPRDVVIVLGLRDLMSPEAAATIGLLSATRGILPAIAALAIMRPYLTMIGFAASSRQLKSPNHTVTRSGGRSGDR